MDPRITPPSPELTAYGQEVTRRATSRFLAVHGTLYPNVNCMARVLKGFANILAQEFRIPPVDAVIVPRRHMKSKTEFAVCALQREPHLIKYSSAIKKREINACGLYLLRLAITAHEVGHSFLMRMAADDQRAAEFPEDAPKLRLLGYFAGCKDMSKFEKGLELGSYPEHIDERFCRACNKVAFYLLHERFEHDQCGAKIGDNWITATAKDTLLEVA